MATPEITILGAGAFGLAVGFAVAKRGAKVRVIDPNGVAAGSSGGVVGALAPHVPENWNDKKAFQLDSLLMAEEFWQEVHDISGRDPGYLRSGRLQPLADERAVEIARSRSEGARELWKGQAEWTVVSSDEHGEWAPRSATNLLVHDTLTARIHPRSATRALGDAIKVLGGEILTDGEVKGVLVEATGWLGLKSLSDQFGKNIGNGVKGQAALLEFRAENAPQLYADSLHIVPHADGTVAIGSTSEREFVSPIETDGQLDDVIERAIAAFPILTGAKVVERWAGVRPRAKSRAPMLGRHPLKDGAFIANGGFKIGFGMAPKVGAVMADLILDGVGAIPEGFKPEASL